MRNLFLIGHHDLTLFLKDKASYIWLVLLPVVFVYFTGAANLGPRAPANPRPPLRIENLDTNFLSQWLLEKLGAKGMRTLEGEEAKEAERGIRIPADFTERVLQQEQVKIGFFKTADSADQSAAMIEFRLLRAVIGLNSDLVQLAAQGKPITEQHLRELQGQAQPVVLDASYAGRNPIPAGFNQSLPGTMVMFLMLNLLIFGAASVSGERESGVIRRLAVYPLTRWQLVLGKVYGRVLLGAFQVAVFLLAGAFLFNVPIGNHLPSIVLGMLLLCWVAASLGVLIGSLITGEEKTIGLCVLASMVMGALGGCWWPLEVVPDFMKTLGHLFPTAWAMDLLHQLISFGGGAEDVLEEMGVLALFAAAANLAAAKLFRV